ncbi:unnamed protein product [Paramecium primaurelia]|uniref:Uncharacterized protein n=1 Tax=Paramecium primaurelia TaxID=5886 RepID=A0A8S1KJU1_PARPR|nr:unnamed protein product [Paramecium primaurelia]
MLLNQNLMIFTQKVMESTQKQIKEFIQLTFQKNVYDVQIMNILIIDRNSQRVDEFIKYNFKYVFMCQNKSLWILFTQIRILYSSNNEQVLINKGSFSEVLRFQKHIQKNDYNLLCKNTNNISKYTNQCVLYPIFNQNQKLLGILEISITVSERIIDKNLKIKTTLLSGTLKFDFMVQNAFDDFLLSKAQYELYKYRRYCMESILTISMIASYFVKHNSFITYKSISTNWDCMTHKMQLLKEEFQSTNYFKKSIEFDETIDLDPILPVLIQPNIYDNQVKALFEVLVQQRNLRKYEQDKICLAVRLLLDWIYVLR